MAIRNNRQTIKQNAAGSIKRRREAGTLSQHALAELVGVSQPLVSAWECGKVAPSIEDLVNIERVLTISPGELLIEVGYGGKQA